MAYVFFVKNGSRLNRTKFVGDYFSSDVVGFFKGYERVFFANEPTFGKDTKVSEPSDFLYVVVKIDEDEVNKSFDKHGFYFIKDLTVEVARRLLNLDTG